MAAVLLFALLVLVAAPASASAQLAPPNAAGVAFREIHLTVTDVEEHLTFWTRAMGGSEVVGAALPTVAFPGVLIVLERGQSSGPPAGSVLDHFGFVYKDIQSQIVHWKLVNADARRGGNDNQGYVWGPDGVRVEYYGDPLIGTPVRMDHFHLFIADVPAAKTWYETALGGVPGQRPRVSAPGQVECSQFPEGLTVSFNPDAARRGGVVLAPTRGRSIDHLTFEVKDLETYLRRLQAAGILVEGPAGSTVPARAAFITDPWGTRIEIVQAVSR